MNLRSVVAFIHFVNGQVGQLPRPEKIAGTIAIGGFLAFTLFTCACVGAISLMRSPVENPVAKIDEKPIDQVPIQEQAIPVAEPAKPPVIAKEEKPEKKPLPGADVIKIAEDQLAAEKETERLRLINERAQAAAKRRKKEIADEEAGDEINIDGLALVKSSVRGSQDGFSLAVTGTVINRRDTAIRFASISYSIYDAQGSRVGDALSTISNLGPGERWNFRAVGFARSGTNYKLGKLVGR